MSKGKEIYQESITGNFFMGSGKMIHDMGYGVYCEAVFNRIVDAHEDFHPSQRTMAREMHCHRRAVKAAVERLEAHRVIACHLKPMPGKPNRQVFEYRILPLSGWIKPTSYGTKVYQGGANVVPERVVPPWTPSGTRGGANVVPGVVHFSTRGGANVVPVPKSPKVKDQMVTKIPEPSAPEPDPTSLCSGEENREPDGQDELEPYDPRTTVPSEETNEVKDSAAHQLEPLTKPFDHRAWLHGQPDYVPLKNPFDHELEKVAVKAIQDREREISIAEHNIRVQAKWEQEAIQADFDRTYGRGRTS